MRGGVRERRRREMEKTGVDPSRAARPRADPIWPHIPPPPPTPNPLFCPPPKGWADYPWWYVDTWSRVSHAVMMTQELLEWVKTAHPYWNRTRGADHVWHFAHDEGACWAPAEVYTNSVILTHWGRLDRNHTSGTSYGQASALLFARWSSLGDDPAAPPIPPVCAPARRPFTPPPQPLQTATRALHTMLHSRTTTHATGATTPSPPAASRG